MKESSFACFFYEKGQALLFENFIVQRIFYFPSAVGKTGKLHERIRGQAVKKRLSDGFKIQTVRRNPHRRP